MNDRKRKYIYSSHFEIEDSERCHCFPV